MHPSPDSSAAADPWLGRVVGGRWRILSLLDDSGGMASVYLADDERLPRKAVVKVPKAARFNAEFAARFAREAHHHARIETVHVVSILDRGEEAGMPYLVLQYLPGGNLKAWCARNPAMLDAPRRHFESWLLPIARALDAVAARGIVHRDVKPTNILFDAAGTGYLSDFGIVKAGGEATMTGTGTFIGTLQFMSPEQCQPESKRSLDGRSDQYGLAVTVYQVLTGWKYPVDDDTAVVYAAKFGHVPMRQPREHAPAVPPGVNDAVMRALSPDRGRRFATSVEFATAVLAGFGVPGDWPGGGSLPLPVPAAGGRGAEPPPLPAQALVDTASRRAAATAPVHAAPPAGPARGWTVPALAFGVIAIALGGVVIAASALGPWWRADAGPREVVAAADVPPGTREPTPATGDVETDSIGMKLVLVPAGEFDMGSADGDDDERPVHRVRIRTPFFIGITEVTQAQWRAVMGSEPWADRDNVRVGPGFAVSYVSWDEAEDFCLRLTERERRAGRLAAGARYRLPTEAEWEYACRAGTSTKWSFGDEDAQVGAYAWYAGNAWDRGAKYPHEVGGKRPNPWGLCDVHGNVAEWCADWKADYPASEATDPTGPAQGSIRVIRGGSWDYNAAGCRSDNRYGGAPTARFGFVGFRVVRTVPSATEPIADVSRPRAVQAPCDAEFRDGHLLLNDVKHEFPIPVTDLVELLGPPDRVIEKANTLLTWDRLGIYAYSTPRSGLVDTVAFSYDPGRYDFSPATAFAGRIRIGAASIGRDSTTRDLAGAGLTQDELLDLLWSKREGVGVLHAEHDGSMRDVSISLSLK